VVTRPQWNWEHQSKTSLQRSEKKIIGHR
jgi:hypothetical protein